MTRNTKSRRRVLSAQDVADYFIFCSYHTSIDTVEPLTNLKLQKMVYYAQGLHLAQFNKPIFCDVIEAWAYGPVIPSLYHKYRKHGSCGIPDNTNFDPKRISLRLRKFLDEIFRGLSQFSAIGLVNLSHNDKCWIDAGINNAISHESMAKELKKYLING